MTNADLAFRREIDGLETGLSERPDVDRIVAGGRRLRRRRHTAAGVAAAMVVAVAVSTLLTLGGSGSPPAVDDSAPDPAAPTSPLVPAPTVADDDFGTGMQAAVTAALPEARFTGEDLADHWRYRPSLDAFVPLASDPVDWDSLFQWSQTYTLPDLLPLALHTQWEPRSDLRTASCVPGAFLVEKDCSTATSDGRTVVVHDGVRLDGQEPDSWSRGISVYTGGANATSWVQVWARTTAPSWAEARDELPSTDELTALALDPRLLLPEPARLPEQTR